jgi:hypothetical protein
VRVPWATWAGNVGCVCTLVFLCSFPVSGLLLFCHRAPVASMVVSSIGLLCFALMMAVSWHQEQNGRAR